MKKPGKESILIAGYISEFLDGYVLSQKTSSMNTLKSYQDAIVLYLSFLEDEKKVRSDSLNADCFRHTTIEDQLRHSKASHWLEDGMNIIQISFLLGHEQLQTTMVYLDITVEEKAKALATLEDENDRKVSAKWKNPDGSLVDFCGIKRKR